MILLSHLLACVDFGFWLTCAKVLKVLGTLNNQVRKSALLIEDFLSVARLRASGINSQSSSGWDIMIEEDKIFPSFCTFDKHLSFAAYIDIAYILIIENLGTTR